jgi:hypothetical protein
MEGPVTRYFTIKEFLREFPYYSEKTIRRRINDGSLEISQLGGPRTKILIVVRGGKPGPDDSAAQLEPPRFILPSGLTAQRRQQGEAPRVPRGGPKPKWMQARAC